MLESFTLAVFTPLLNQTFRVSYNKTDSVELVLTEAKCLSEKPYSALSDHRLPFSLLFRGPNGIRLEQQIYPFHHPDLGSFELFIVPIAENQNGREYEAIFT